MTTLQAIRLPKDIIESAQQYGKIFSRSAPKQISYWIKIGKLAEENPDIPFSMLQDILLGLEEVKNKQTTEYSFG